MRLAAVSATIGLLLTAPTNAQDAWRTYTNPRFSVSANYPAMFSRRDEPPSNGDGQGFTTIDGRAHLIIFGSYNIDHETPAHLMAERKVAGVRYSYTKAGKGWFVLSGIKGNEITYLRCNLGHSDAIGCAELSYPAAEAASWSKTVARVSSSLRVSEPSNN